MLFAIPSHGLYCPWNSPGQSTAVDSLSLLHQIFPTQELNPGLTHCGWILYQLSRKRSLRILNWVTYPFCGGSYQPRNQTRVSCIAGRFFTTELSGKPKPLNYQRSSQLSYDIAIYIHSGKTLRLSAPEHKHLLIPQLLGALMPRDFS